MQPQPAPRDTDTPAPPIGLPDELVRELIAALQALRTAMQEEERRHLPSIEAAHPARREGARNLAHYLALRRVDLRSLQATLSSVGLSSFSQSASSVMQALEQVLSVLKGLDRHSHDAAARASNGPASCSSTGTAASGNALLASAAQDLLGPACGSRSVRIMVTLPREAALDAALLDAMIASGMDIARINCAHDDAATWIALAAQVRAAGVRAGRPIKVLMDLGGPKLRTGRMPCGPRVLRIKPQRDAFGRVLSPALIGLRARGSELTVAGASIHLEVDPRWLAHAQTGDRIAFVDARDAHREFKVLERQAQGGVLVSCDQTAYLVPQTLLQLKRSRTSSINDALCLETTPEGIAPLPGRLRLHQGDLLRLVAEGAGQPMQADGAGQAATVSCTLPQALASIRVGHRVFFDDGKIGGRVLAVWPDRVEIEITAARPSGEVLAADKGINLPDSTPDLAALTPQDREDLSIVAAQADLVGMSFVQSPDDVMALQQHLVAAGAAHIGIILKIETQRGFERLPELLFAAMRAPSAGVMIARGDLAVECGYERLAEVQEEILWACESAHLPVVWATQVLETQAKTGLPSRAEITDAAMGVRAECVMLNKGPHILDAIRTLDKVLSRMQTHQFKHRALMRALRAWG